MEKQPLRIKSLPMVAEGRLIEPGAHFPVGEYHPVLIIAETPTGYWGIPGVQDVSELNTIIDKTPKFYVDVRPARTTVEYTITGSTKDNTKVTGKYVSNTGVETTVTVNNTGRLVHYTITTPGVAVNSNLVTRDPSSVTTSVTQSTAYLLYRLLGHVLNEAPINTKQ